MDHSRDYPIFFCSRICWSLMGRYINKANCSPNQDAWTGPYRTASPPGWNDRWGRSKQPSLITATSKKCEKNETPFHFFNPRRHPAQDPSASSLVAPNSIPRSSSSVNSDSGSAPRSQSLARSGKKTEHGLGVLRHGLHFGLGQQRCRSPSWFGWEGRRPAPGWDQDVGLKTRKG